MNLQIRQFLKPFFRLLYPPRCPGCDELLPLQKGSCYRFCPACRKRLRPAPVQISLSHTPTQQPQKSPGQNPPEYPRQPQKAPGQTPHAPLETRTLYAYEGVIRSSLYRFKYGNRRGYAEAYAYDAVKLYGNWIFDTVRPDAILAVPMYRGKKRLRGYNQAEEFARALSEMTGIPFYGRVLVRTRDTKPQKGLQAAERANNLKNAFKICQNGLQLERILVVDDIYTTGTTLREITKVLTEAGSSAVYCLCIGSAAGGGEPE